MKAIIASILLFCTAAMFGQEPLYAVFSPYCDTIASAVGDLLFFKIEATHGDSVRHYQWKKDGEIVGTGNDLYCSFDQTGEHRITSEVSDGKSNERKTWIVNVEPFDESSEEYGGVTISALGYRKGPNPFSSNPVSLFFGETPLYAEIEIIDMQQQHVRQLFKGYLNSSAHRLIWSGTDDLGNMKENGPYCIKAQSGQDTTGKIKKRLLIK